MGNPNSFYRFDQGWNAGFYPDNQIVSDLLNEVYSAVNAALPSIAIIGTTTYGQLKTQVTNIVNQYNESPYYGNFKVEGNLIFTSPDFIWDISVKDDSLYKLDVSQIFYISGTAANGTQILLTSSIGSFTPGAYSGSFDTTLIPEELKVQEALECVNLNGSAIFPITYQYNSTIQIATSGLARGANWKLDDGVVNRFPADTLPRQNRRQFELPALTGDDQYIISIMDRIVQASLNDPDYITSIYATYDNYIILPDGWGSSVEYPSYITYERVQFNYSNSIDRVFALVGRRDGSSWLWQRFVTNIITPSIYNFINNYSEVTPLPYEPNQAGRWLYGDSFYDFEFVEFSSGCYVSNEFYPMPAKPGDQWQFNIADANLTGLDQVNVGLFTEDGTFVQKIGTATKPADISCTDLNYLCSHTFTYTLAAEDVEAYLMSISDTAFLAVDFYITYLKYYIVNSSNEEISSGLTQLSWASDSALTVEQVISQSLLSGVIFTENEGSYTIEWTVDNLPCNDTYTFKSNAGYPLTETLIFTGDEYECVCPVSTVVPTQHQASVTIPSKNGCFRLGAYNDPPVTCAFTFEFTLEGIDLSGYIAAVQAISGGLAPWLMFQILATDNYSYQPTNTETPESIAAWCNANIPGMTVVTTESSMTFTWVRTGLNCGETYIMSNCSSTSGAAGSCSGYFWSSDPLSCDCETSYYLYSLSNIINIDASDCFSTILEFWADTSSISEGFEYFDNWKQRIRIGLNGGGEKPIIEENLYRQSNGVHRRPQNKQDLSLDLHTDFFDLDTQLAMTDATRHPYLVWEGKSIFVKGDIEVATIQDFTTQSSFETLSQMKFQALKQGFQPRNSSCLTC